VSHNVESFVWLPIQTLVTDANSHWFIVIAHAPLTHSTLILFPFNPKLCFYLVTTTSQTQTATPHAQK